MISAQNPASGSEAPTTGQDAVSRVAQGAHAAVDRVAEKAAPAVERLRSGVSGATRALRRRAEDLTELQERWVESSRGSVRERPLVAIVAAFAVGLIVGRLLDRD